MATPWTSAEDASRGAREAGMIVSTTTAIEGRPVKQYLGVVTGEVIVGANLFRDIFASITDLVGGRSGKYEEVLSRARREAIAEMKSEAMQLGGNAVIGVDIDYEVLGQKGSMLMVSVSGTAVLL
ncbi:hypothetical protein A6F65_00176 [Paraurantiacibacter namhicola]|uniref:UPF0145 protein A6F65_00176 n=2 Tax=Paraurantiacibacter namhicola TaxID=645517 RepID=A0A1C7D5C5_9SPHN|nr:hypothetical protein A6F65_00176 [Paraurantiacibacter namhicola]